MTMAILMVTTMMVVVVLVVIMLVVMLMMLALRQARIITSRFGCRPKVQFCLGIVWHCQGHRYDAPVRR